MPSVLSEANQVDKVITVLRSAVELHRVGRLDEAQPLYREALLLDPGHPDALHLAGVLAHQAGRGVEALELVDRALARLPGFAEAHNSRGNILRALGRPDDALGAYRQAIALAPLSPLAWSNLGNALWDLGRPEEAIRAYREALSRAADLAETRLNLGLVLSEQGDAEGALVEFDAAIQARPDLAAAHYRRGQSLRALGRRAEAIESLRRAVSLSPQFLAAYCDLGITLSEAGQQLEATDALQAALALDPDRPEAHNYMGKVCQALGYPGQALSAYRQAIAVRPDYADAHYNLAALFGELHRPVEAVASYRAALTFRADWAEAHASLGGALLRLGRSPEAMLAVRRALELDPTPPTSWYLLGRAAAEQGQFGDAVAAYDRALAIDPAFAEAHWHRALALLSAGDYEAGWRDYEWRWMVPALRRTVREFGAPRWQGEDLAGRSILVHAEAEPGDTLQFARFLPLVAERGARVILECQPALARLLEAMPAPSQVLAPGDDLPPFDYQVPLESLPGILGTRLETVPNTLPYLPTQSWSGKVPVLPADSRRGPRIGLAWAGPSGGEGDASRLRRLAPLFAGSEASWYSFEASGLQAELAQVPEAHEVHDLSPLIHDLTDAASLLQQLDLLITTENLTAHLAGGLGVPVWLLRSASPDWRWAASSGSAPVWYPTVRVFTADGEDWGRFIASVSEALAQTMAGAAAR
ncbi:MAG TPA: tetratricopeptide repeat protein [Gemmatimonadales bacterium]|nr:tetratricopeptide repeat protein [Gemmatimonadales bacterium]